MGVWELILLAIGLSMDAFAVSVCKGLAMEKVTLGRAARVGLWFGGFQALMPLIGYLVGARFQAGIAAIDHWIAFVLLGVIGANMIRESLSAKADEPADASTNVKAMLPLAIATSIDALAVGVTFAFLDVRVVPAVLTIGAITFFLSGAGVRFGNIVGMRFRSRAELAGGGILILLGLKTLLEHLGVIG